MFQVLKAGLETTVQDYPGRLGYFKLGIPSSGPADSLSFTFANRLVGNPETAAGIEMQIVGPELEILNDGIVAICGADNAPQRNGERIPLWQAIAVNNGDNLKFSGTSLGARTYLAWRGGIDVAPVLGSRSTCLSAKIGGYSGRALRAKDIVRTGDASDLPPVEQSKNYGQNHSGLFTHAWEITVGPGPYSDVFSAEDNRVFFETAWKVSTKSNRIGYRLDGPKFTFSEAARQDAERNDSHPSNRHDYPCALGSILICGQTPVVLLCDGPTLTGYATPYVVRESEIWKVAQGRPNDSMRFRLTEW